MRKRTFKMAVAVGVALSVLALLSGSCLPKPASETGGINTTLYGSSIRERVAERATYPGFPRRWKQEHGQDVKFTSSFAGSENGY